MNRAHYTHLALEDFCGHYFSTNHFVLAMCLGNIAWTLVQGPLQIIAGLAAGCLGGVFLWYIPQRSSVSTELSAALYDIL